MSIHQEAVIKASPGQIYEFLTNGEIFMAATEQPAQVSDREGEPALSSSDRTGTDAHLGRGARRDPSQQLAWGQATLVGSFVGAA